MCNHGRGTVTDHNLTVTAVGEDAACIDIRMPLSPALDLLDVLSRDHDRRHDRPGVA